ENDPILPLVEPEFNCLLFDGIDDRVRLNSTAPISNIDTSDFTIEMTIKPEMIQNTASPVLFSNYQELSGGGGPFQLIVHSGFRILLYENTSISPYKMLALQKINIRSLVGIPLPQSIYYVPNNGSIGNILDGRCYRITVTKSGTDLAFYINGLNIGNFSTNDVSYLDISSPKLPVLGNDTESSRPYNGTISDFRVWNYARTSTQIANADPRTRFSMLEDGLLVNFELLDIQSQIFNSNGLIPLTATLGIDDTPNSDDPIVVDCNNCYSNPCPFQEDSSKPFGGRDIVYIHGLNLDHLMLPFNSPPSFTGKWPADKEDFYIGDFKSRAFSTWEQHIARELCNGGNINNPTNNYLVASYPCAQRLSTGINAVVTQIKDAIETGRGVVWAQNNQDCRQVFGKEIVLISHSTGGLLTSTLVGLGPMSNPSSPSYDLNVELSQGDFKAITDKVQAHVAFNGALLGSPLARMALRVSNSGIGTTTAAFETLFGDAIRTADQVMCDWQQSNNNPKNWVNVDVAGFDVSDFFVPGWSICPDLMGVLNAFAALNPGWANNTCLRDLEPINSNKWANFAYGNATCSTVTGASTFAGIPQNKRWIEATVAKTIINGPDDGVLLMDCQCARDKAANGDLNFVDPSTFVSVSPKLRNFDLGNPLSIKSFTHWREMTRGGLNLANACVSGKTTTGMLTKLDVPSTHDRWPNHYSFLQGAGYHYEAWDLGLSTNYYEGW
ncbi:MAG: LamG domain-containing protein, partial [Bacteroidota bacterium]